MAEESFVLHCLIWLVISCLIAVIMLYVIETVLGLFLALPSQVFVLMRCLAALLVLMTLLQCLGVLSGGTPRRVLW